MKKLLTPLFALAIMFSVTVGFGKEAPEEVAKGKIENVAEAPTPLQIEHKEAYKIDDGEYEGAVISKSGINSNVFYSTLGIFAIVALLIITAIRKRFTSTQISIGTRLLIASLILFMAKGINPMAGMVLAGIVMAFPSLKSWATQKRLSRLAVGETEESEELKAIKDISTQVKDFKKTLGDKADKTLFDEINKNLKDLKDGLKDWTGEKIETKMKEINDAMLKVATQIGEMQEAVAKTKEGGSNTAGKPLLTTKEVEDFVAATFKDGSKTHNNATIKLNANHVFKAAETFGYGTFFEGGAGTQIDAFTGRFVDPTLYQRTRKKNLILDHFAIETITVPKLIYLEKKEVSGAGDSGSTSEIGGADWIVSGAPKPMRSFRVTTGEVTAKKLAIFGTVEDKLLRDVPSLENWIREDFMDEMLETYNDGLLNNNPAVDPDAPLGLKQNAIQYSATTAFDNAVVDPTYIDMIVAAAAKQADLKEQPGKAFVSSDVWYAMQILKDNDDRYQNNNLVYTSTNGKLYIAGVEVIPSDSEDVPSTHLLMIAANPGFKIKNYGPMVFERGLNGEDFREDKTSYRGYQEVLSYIPEHKENTIMYDTWANIEAAITSPGS